MSAGPIDHAALALGAAALGAAVPIDQVPASIGRYRVFERIGRGGMGTVYRASLDHPRRDVAVKVLDRIAGDSRSARRFRAEAECLARLDDPRIVRVLDAGTARIDGATRPFLVMDLVADAEPITAFVERRAPSRRARLELLAEVAEAVAHAHRRGVLHRDLKPANVLVDRDGRPRIVDFGVARALDADGPGPREALTRHGDFVGTLEWMAPEQLADAGEIDLRTDVHALGLIAYRVLAGEPALDTSGSSIERCVRTIMERRPAPLGHRDPALRGDVERVVAKALEKEPARRYGSAAELAEDLRAVLESRPVAARPPTVGYVLGRAARRHPARTIALAVAVLAALAVSALLADAHARHDAAQRRAIATHRVTSEILTGLTPLAIGSGEPGDVVALLDRIETQVDVELAAHPAQRCAVLQLLGFTRRRFSDSAGAQRAFEQAVAAAIESEGPRTRSVIRSMMLLADHRMIERDLDGAESLCRDALEIVAEGVPELGPDEPDQLRARLARIASRRGDLETAREGLIAALRSVEARSGPDNSLRLELLGDLLVVDRRRGDDASALAWGEEALARRRAQDPEGSDPETHRLAGRVGHLKARLGRRNEALRLLADALAGAMRVHGVDRDIASWIGTAFARTAETESIPPPEIEVAPLDPATLHAAALGAEHEALARRVRDLAAERAGPESAIALALDAGAIEEARQRFAALAADDLEQRSARRAALADRLRGTTSSE